MPTNQVPEFPATELPARATSRTDRCLQPARTAQMFSEVPMAAALHSFPRLRWMLGLRNRWGGRIPEWHRWRWIQPQRPLLTSMQPLSRREAAPTEFPLQTSFTMTVHILPFTPHSSPCASVTVDPFHLGVTCMQGDKHMSATFACMTH